MTRREWKRRKAMNNSVKGKQGLKYVSYSPFNGQMVVVNPPAKMASDRDGNTWRLVY